MQKLHITPIATHLRKSISQSFTSAQDGYQIQVQDNTISFQLNFNRNSHRDDNLRLLLEKFRASLRKYRNNYCQQFHLFLYGSCGLDQRQYSKLGRAVAENFRNLRELTFHFVLCGYVTDETLGRLLTPLSRNMSNLRRLTMNLCKCPNITDKGLNYIRSLAVVKAKNLEKLVMNSSAGTLMKDRERISPLQMDEKFESIYNQKKVFKRISDKITEEGLDLLTETISKYLKNLQQFTFAPLLWEPTSQHETIINHVLRVLSRLTKLSALHLGFICLNDKHIGNLGLCIGKNLKNLKYLALDIQSSRIDFEAGEGLAQFAANIFPNLSLLKGIALSTELNTMSRVEDLPFIREMCQHAKNLELLNLRLPFVIPSRNIQNIFKLISQNLNNLQKLTWTIKYSADSNIAEDPDLYVLSNLKELNLSSTKISLDFLLSSKTLEILTLVFWDCRDAATEHYEKLAHNISLLKLENLRQFTLILNEGGNLTDDFVNLLCSQGLANMHNLDDFTLKLVDSQLLTDSTLKHIGIFVQENLKNLRKLTLSFQKCTEITQNGIKSLIIAFAKSLTHLEELELDFSREYGEKVVPLEVIGAVLDKIARGLKCLRKLKLNFIFSRSQYSASDEEHTLGWPFERFIKKLSFIPDVKIEFGPK